MTKNSTSYNQWISIAVASVLLLGAVVYVADLDATVEVAQVEEVASLPPVSVVAIEPSIAQAETRSLAQIQPLWTADLRASSAGRVLEVTDRALAGRRVETGDVLVLIEDIALIADLRAAEFALAEAEVALTDARNQTELRRSQARSTPDIEPTEFSLRLPQLRLAENSVLSAEAQVAAARLALDNATIRAPFDGFVSERSVSPGQQISQGDVLLSIVDGKRFELETGLSTRQWRLLHRPLGGAEVAVFTLRGEQLGIAKVREAGGFRDEETREFKVFLEITRSPDALQDVQLLSGDLVELVFAGQSFENVLSVPESSLTRDGDIWHVDDEDRLVRFEPEILWQSESAVVIRPPNAGELIRVATEPLASFLAGVKVTPIAREQP